MQSRKDMDFFPNINLATSSPTTVASAVRRANDRLAGTAELVTVCSHLSTSWFRQSCRKSRPSKQIAVFTPLIDDAFFRDDDLHWGIPLLSVMDFQRRRYLHWGIPHSSMTFFFGMMLCTEA